MSANNVTLQVLLSITGGQAPVNNQTPVLVAQLTNSLGDARRVPLAAGPNYIYPSIGFSETWTWCLLLPPSGSAVTKLLKYQTADAGYQLGNPASYGGLLVIPVGTAAAPTGAPTGAPAGTFILNASAPEECLGWFV